jgi:AcrR family transcriptional regulator
LSRALRRTLKMIERTAGPSIACDATPMRGGGPNAHNRNEPRMPRTRSPLFDEKRTFIRDRCAFLFASKGYPSASLEDIARECDMVKSVLYHYHKSKESILLEIILAHVEDVRGRAEASIEGLSDPQERFEAFVVSLIDTYARSRDQQTVLNNDRNFLSRHSKKKVHAAEKRLIDLTAEVIERLNPALKRTPELRNVVVMLFFGMVNWTYTWYRIGGPMPPSALASLISRLCLDGFRSFDTSEWTKHRRGFDREDRLPEPSR